MLLAFVLWNAKKMLKIITITIHFTLLQIFLFLYNKSCFEHTLTLSRHWSPNTSFSTLWYTHRGNFKQNYQPRGNFTSLIVFFLILSAYLNFALNLKCKLIVKLIKYYKQNKIKYVTHLWGIPCTIFKEYFREILCKCQILRY